jgi:hypothetical protein
MSYKEDKKFSAEDFASYESIDDLFNTDNAYYISSIDQNDDEGYTPLCAAILNNADPLMLLYLTSVSISDSDEELNSKGLIRSNCLPKNLRGNNPKGADVSLACDKGKSPLQIAIMSCNTIAINTLFGNNIINVIAQEKRGSSGYYKDVIRMEPSDGKDSTSSTRLPVYIKDDNGNPTDQYDYITIGIKISDSYSAKLVVIAKDILDASSLTKSDILKAISYKYTGKWYYESKMSYDNSCKLFDKYGNTPLIMASKAQCYDSVKFILEKISGWVYQEDGQSPDKLHSTQAILYTNKPLGDELPISALLLASDNNDNGLLKIFLKYLSDDIALLDIIFKQDNYTELLSTFLLSKGFTSSHSIYTWLSDNDELLLTKEFETNEKIGGTDTYKKNTVLYFIESNSSNEELYSLVIDYYSNTQRWFREFANEDRPCYNLISLLYSNGKISLENINNFIPDSYIKNAIIISLFNKSEITIKQIFGPSTCFNNVTVCNVINELYSIGSLKIDDIQYVYDNYSISKHSSLHTDLQPFIGKMKFSSGPTISSSFYWAYSFSNHTGTNWYNPQCYHDSALYLTPDDSLQDVGGDKYSEVKILYSGQSSPGKPSKFRFSIHNNAPEFFTNTQYTASDDHNNGVVFSFTHDTKFTLPSDLYTVDVINHTVTWNTDHIIYDLFKDNRCFTSNAGVVFDSTPITLSEGAFSDRKFKLQSKPTSNVTITFTSNNINVAVSPQSIIFTSLNWDTKQAVSFTSNDNHTITGDTDAIITISVASNDYYYNSINDSLLHITVEENDTAGLNYTTSAITLTEGNSHILDFNLKSQPESNVTISFSCSNSRLNISPLSLVFTPSNWDIDKQVILSVNEDSIADGDETAAVNIVSSSDDMNYNFTCDPLAVSIKDNDTSGIIYNSSQITMLEGSPSKIRTFKLMSQPASNVVVSFTYDHNDRLSVLPSSLTFTPGNWDTEQNVAFSATDNSITDGNLTVNVRLSTLSGDSHYNNITDSIIVNITDDDANRSLGTLAFETDTFPVITGDDIINFIQAYDSKYHVESDFGVIYSEFNKP